MYVRFSHPSLFSLLSWFVCVMCDVTKTTTSTVFLSRTLFNIFYRKEKERGATCYCSFLYRTYCNMRLSAAATYLVTTSIGSTLLAGSYCEGRTSLFQSNFAAFGVSKSSSKQQQALSSSVALNLRGGGESDEDITSEKDDVVTELYLPGLLEAEVSLRTGQSTVSEDSTVSISSKKARELGLKAGDIVKIIGRRRRFSFCTIKVLKGVNGCRLGRVLAGNLRIRSGDKLKIVPLDSEDVSILLNSLICAIN